jgi:hypothetical protein
LIANVIHFKLHCFVFAGYAYPNVVQQGQLKLIVAWVAMYGGWRFDKVRNVEVQFMEVHAAATKF